MSRLAKQLFYGGVYCAIILLIAWPTYRLMNPAATCSDGIQNGTEEGVDCGAVCGLSCPMPVMALEQRDSVILQTGPNQYDVLVHLENVNATYGASRVEYAVTIRDANATELAVRRGVTYVNPAQPRYLLFPLRDLATAPASVTVFIEPSDVQWSELSIEAAGDVQFSVRGDRFSTASGSAEYYASVANRSTFNFDDVDVVVLVHDASGGIVGADTTTIRTMIAGEERGIAIKWPFAIPSGVRAESIVTTNVFANENFIRTHGSQERFQER